MESMMSLLVAPTGACGYALNGVPVGEGVWAADLIGNEQSCAPNGFDPTLIFQPGLDSLDPIPQIAIVRPLLLKLLTT